MGMVVFFQAIDAERLQAVKDDPDRLAEILFPEDEGEDDGEEGGGVDEIDIDKAWHGLHHLLGLVTGDEEAPAARAILGGTEIGEDDGYGPPRYFDPEEVREIAAALDEITEEQLSAVFDPARMTAEGIYPESIWADEGQEALDYLLGYYPEMVDFYRRAAERGDGVLLGIS
ncbi:YfbM family protein [Roseateles chitinivorans]|uniref:YfbM family protein n=1 Tax=Roseateles chitinivorans TaxID=2917965 RepID=UPI003D66F6D6